jgi:hypothetical protein
MGVRGKDSRSAVTPRHPARVTGIGDGRGRTRRGAHRGFVAGRYRNGAWSDSWTEVGRCAPGTFTAFAPACRCGWRGESRLPASAAGEQACLLLWANEHLTTPSSVRAGAVWDPMARLTGLGAGLT